MKLLQITCFLFLISCSVNERIENINKQYRGSIEIEELFSEYSIFKTGYDNYVPSDFSVLKYDDVSVVIFFGTWCHDSKRELPKALKIFNEIGINDENIELIAVGLDKKEPQGRAAKLRLMYTPTLIFFRGSQEIGRIIEKPVISLEKDIALIISSI
jgi:thiol-disulfide isomerase/thioredoxin